jgi:hypothetical protein
MKVECYRNNKKILDIELSMTKETFKKQLEKGVLRYYTSKGIEIINLNQFDKVIIKCNSYKEDLELLS